MPQPTLGDVHVDAALTDLSVRFTQQKDEFIADQVFPTVGVQNRSDVYYTFDRQFWYKTDAELRGPGSESAGSGFEQSTDNFSCDVYALHKDIDDQTRANADSQIQLDTQASEFLAQHMLQRREQDWVSTFFTTGVWTTDITPTNTWDDYANGDPIQDLRTGVIAMKELTAYRPNTLVLGAHVWDKLQDHPDFLDRIKYTEKAIMGPDLLASMLRIDRVLIAESVANTAANEGETASYSFNFGNHALLLHVASSPGLNTPSAGYTFKWNGLFGGGSNGIRVKRFRLERNASDRIEAEEAIDQKLVSAELGYFFNAAVA